MNKILGSAFIVLCVFSCAFSQDVSDDFASDPDKTAQEVKPDTSDKSDPIADEDVYDKSGSFVGLQRDFNRGSNVGFNFGYQFYFGRTQRQGIKITTHFNFYFDAEDDAIGVPKNKNNVQSIGFDIKYLYDFLEFGHFTLGFNAGLGYQRLSLYDKTDPTVEDYLAHKNDKSQSHYNVMAIVGLHMYYRSIEFEVLSGYPNILRGIIAYRF